MEVKEVRRKVAEESEEKTEEKKTVYGMPEEMKRRAEEWKVLYEAATRIGELKPWEKFWDLDLIGIRYGEEDDMVFFSILGRGGGCYGLVVYEGYEGLNSFAMSAGSDSGG